MTHLTRPFDKLRATLSLTRRGLIRGKNFMTKVERGWSGTLEWRRRLRKKMTPAEVTLWRELRGRSFQQLKFRRQHGIGPFIVDFYCAERRLVIEVDGNIHMGEDQRGHDQGREQYLEAAGLKVIRYSNDEIVNNINGVLRRLHLICAL